MNRKTNQTARGVDVVTEQDEVSEEDIVIQAIVENVVEAQEYVVELFASCETEIDLSRRAGLPGKFEIWSKYEETTIGKIRGDTLDLDTSNWE